MTATNKTTSTKDVLFHETKIRLCSFVTPELRNRSLERIVF